MVGLFLYDVINCILIVGCNLALGRYCVKCLVKVSNGSSLHVLTVSGYFSVK